MKNTTSTAKDDKALALHYMETLVEVSRESFLILDRTFRVISANDVFYHNFQVSPKQTENKLLYELGMRLRIHLNQSVKKRSY